MTNPADAFASPFGWHDTNGAAGPEFTTTQGNNAHAYSDRDNDNNPDPGSSPSGGPTLQFDFIADYFADQPQSYTDSTVTNLFYWCNMVHDLSYQYGFNERPATSRSTTTARAAPAATTCAARRRTAPAPTTPTSPRRRRTADARGCRCSCGRACSSACRARSRSTPRRGGRHLRRQLRALLARTDHGRARRPDPPRQRRHRHAHRRLPAVHGARRARSRSSTTRRRHQPACNPYVRATTPRTRARRRS